MQIPHGYCDKNKVWYKKKSKVVECYDDDLTKAIEYAKSAADYKKVLTILYLVFDNMLHYQYQVSKLVRKRLNIHIIDKENSFPNNRKDFLYKYVTHTLNAQRRYINEGSRIRSNQTFTIMRYGDALKKAKSKHDNRKKSHFYTWMVVKHDKVSCMSYHDSSFCN